MHAQRSGKTLESAPRVPCGLPLMAKGSLGQREPLSLKEASSSVKPLPCSPPFGGLTFKPLATLRASTPAVRPPRLTTEAFWWTSRRLSYTASPSTLPPTTYSQPASCPWPQTHAVTSEGQWGQSRQQPLVRPCCGSQAHCQLLQPCYPHHLHPHRTTLDKLLRLSPHIPAVTPHVQPRRQPSHSPCQQGRHLHHRSHVLMARPPQAGGRCSLRTPAEAASMAYAWYPHSQVHGRGRPRPLRLDLERVGPLLQKGLTDSHVPSLLYTTRTQQPRRSRSSLGDVYGGSSRRRAWVSKSRAVASRGLQASETHGVKR